MNAAKVIAITERWEADLDELASDEERLAIFDEIRLKFCTECGAKTEDSGHWC